jgi:phospholipid/cholesterol/gamma-HCH transport system ATP-binding protein
MSRVDASPSSSPLLSFRDVTFRRQGRVILDSVSFDVHAGEIVALIGPSGVGKSTLFRLALGFLRPDAGEIRVVGEETSRLDEAALTRVRENVGIVFQDAALFTSLDVEENVGFGLSEMKLPEAQLRERVRGALAAVGLTELRERMPDELSGGQAQRVAVARAIVTAPRVMLYDEPTQGLDPRLGLELVQQIRTLAETGVASLIVTHQLEYWRGPQQRIVLLDEGRIRYDGPAGRLGEVDDVFVRAFFGVLDHETAARTQRVVTAAAP